VSPHERNEYCLCPGVFELFHKLAIFIHLYLRVPCYAMLVAEI
jgi:hypothetical protein